MGHESDQRLRAWNVIRSVEAAIRRGRYPTGRRSEYVRACRLVGRPPVSPARVEAPVEAPVETPVEAPAPETPVPETPAPETPVPETPVPETPAPEAPIPETPATAAPVVESTPDLPMTDRPLPQDEAIRAYPAPAASTAPDRDDREAKADPRDVDRWVRLLTLPVSMLDPPELTVQEREMWSWAVDETLTAHPRMRIVWWLLLPFVLLWTYGWRVARWWESRRRPVPAPVQAPAPKAGSVPVDGGLFCRDDRSRDR